MRDACPEQEKNEALRAATAAANKGGSVNEARLALAGFLGILAATLAPQRVFDFLVSSSGALIVFVYMAIAGAQIALRRRRQHAGEPAPAVQMWLFPWLSYAAIAAMAAVLIAMAFTPALQQDFKASCITLVVAILASRLVGRVRRPALAT